MSKLKRCPLCNSEFELDTDKRFYIHPLVGCYFDCLTIKADNENSIEKWNTRKPMERIVELLEGEMQYLCDARRKISFDMYKNKELAEKSRILLAKELSVFQAIEIVKEEGELNE